MTRLLLPLLVVLAGCAAQQTVLLMPRGEGGRGTGVFDHINQRLVVDLDGQRYEGRPIGKTATTTGYSVFSPQSTTTTNEESALLIGPAGQVRCDFAWDHFRTMANGVCVDARNAVYDLLIRNP